MSNSVKQAVILSGGGANGAYEVGVLKALCTGASPATSFTPLTPDICAGTSIGAYNAAAFITGGANAAAATRLAEIWRSLIPHDEPGAQNGFVRYRADPFELAALETLGQPFAPSYRLAGDLAFLARDWYRRGLDFFLAAGRVEERALRLVDLSSFVSHEPARRLMQATVDFAALRQAPQALRIAATNWRTGELRIFTNAEMTEEIGPQALLASAAIPGLFPPIELAGEFYADGGVVLNTPLNLGIEAGADILHVVYLDPETRAIPLPPVRNTADTINRMFVIQFAATLNRDIEIARRINQGLAQTGDTASALLTVGGQRVYRLLTIHRYQPRTLIGGMLGLFDFRSARLQELMERGFQDAAAHDCAASGCITI